MWGLHLEHPVEAMREYLDIVRTSLRDGGCAVHASASYPAVCKNFPWLNDRGDGPYEFDRGICPELRARS